MIKVGDSVRFIPTLWHGAGNTNEVVTGRIVYINVRHRYVVVEYECRGNKLRETFKFAYNVDIDIRSEVSKFPRQVQSKHGNVCIY